jgi:hypothetical protein
VKIKFKDVQRGIVQARAVIEISEGIFVNEITIIKRGRDISVELPQKSFKGKDGKMHYIDIITFDSEQKKTLWLLEVKEAYENWRKTFRNIEIYESNTN